MSTSLPSDPEDEDLAFINGMCPQIFVPMEMMDLEEEEADDYIGDQDDEETYFDHELPMDEHFAIRHFGMMSRREQSEIYNHYASVRCAIEVQRIKERAQLRRQGAIDDEDDQE